MSSKESVWTICQERTGRQAGRPDILKELGPPRAVCRATGSVRKYSNGHAGTRGREAGGEEAGREAGPTISKSLVLRGPSPAPGELAELYTFTRCNGGSTLKATYSNHIMMGTTVFSREESSLTKTLTWGPLKSLDTIDR